MFFRSSVNIMFEELGSENSVIFTLNFSIRLANCDFVFSLDLIYPSIPRAAGENKERIPKNKKVDR